MYKFDSNKQALKFLRDKMNIKIDANAKIPKRKLGKTGINVGIFSLGGQGALENQRNKDEMAEIIQRAYELGVNYFDTSPIYGPSEDYYGYAIQDFRQNITLATKSKKRDRDGALKDLENSLKRLKTDYIDIWQIHHISKKEEIEQIFSPGGALEAFVQMKNEGVVKHIGVTGHEDPNILVEMLNRFPFETVLCIVNPADANMEQSFASTLYPVANKMDIGIVGMKVFAQGYIFHPEGLKTTWEPLYYALSQPISNIIVGCDSVAQLEENVALAKGFYKLSNKQLKDIENSTKKYIERGAFFRKEFGGYHSKDNLEELIIQKK